MFDIKSYFKYSVEEIIKNPNIFIERLFNDFSKMEIVEFLNKESVVVSMVVSGDSINEYTEKNKNIIHCLKVMHSSIFCNNQISKLQEFVDLIPVITKEFYLNNYKKTIEINEIDYNILFYFVIDFWNKGSEESIISILPIKIHEFNS